MNKRRIRIAIFIALLAYLPVAPIFGSYEYGVPVRSHLPNDGGDLYFWLDVEWKTYYWGVFGIRKGTLNDPIGLVFEPGKRRVDRIEITRGLAKTDGAVSANSVLEGSRINADQIPKYGSEVLWFNLQNVPTQSIELRVEGLLYGTSGSAIPFETQVSAQVRQKTYVLPLYKFVWGVLTYT